MTGLAELVKLLSWYVALGLAACGAAWCGSYGSVTDAMRDLRPRTCRERELLSEVARGLAEIEAFLSEQQRPAAPRRPRRAPGYDLA